VARSIHLLRSPDESREIARSEIKKEFFRLSAAKIPTKSEKTRNRILKSLESDFEKIDKPEI